MTAVGGASVADLHSHLIPGVDDGARSLEEALEAVERMGIPGPLEEQPLAAWTT